MENNRNRRNQTPALPLSPRLLRSKSGAPNMSAPPMEIPHPLTPISIRRSKSTTKTRIMINRDEENLVGISRRHRNSEAAKAVETAKTKKTRSISSSPSAWALSPGRSSPMRSSMESSCSSGSKMKSSGVSGVLKYFRSKKVSAVQEEAFHRYRVLHTRALQWRFVNARAETVMATRNSVAEKKLFSAWLRIFRSRNSVVEKRIQVQNLRQNIKLIGIIDPEIHLLNEWAKIEKRNSEAVSKLARNLSALSVGLPLIKGAKSDMISVYKAMCMAMDVISSLGTTITPLIPQVEETYLLLKELIKTARLEIQSLEELRKTIAMVASLKGQEESLRVFLIQAAKDGVIARVCTGSVS